MNLDSQLTSTPMTSHSHTREEKPHDDHVTLQLYDKPLNRSVHVGMFNINMMLLVVNICDLQGHICDCLFNE